MSWRLGSCLSGDRHRRLARFSRVCVCFLLGRCRSRVRRCAGNASHRRPRSDWTLIATKSERKKSYFALSSCLFFAFLLFSSGASNDVICANVLLRLCKQSVSPSAASLSPDKRPIQTCYRASVNANRGQAMRNAFPMEITRFRNVYSQTVCLFWQEKCARLVQLSIDAVCFF